MSKVSAVVVAAVMVVFTAALATAQSPGETPSCASKLTACANYLNATTKPPATCCNPLKEAITNEKACLCSIYNDPKLVEAFNINITQAKNLPKLCNIDSSPDFCKGLAKSPSSSTPSGSSPPGNAAGRNAGTGLAAILFLFGACLILY